MTLYQELSDTGKVETISDGICKVAGIKNVAINSVLLFPSGVKGMVIGFQDDFAEVIVFGDYSTIRKGDFVRLIDEKLLVPSGEGMIGRVINALGEPLDENGKISAETFSQFENQAKNVFQREGIAAPLETGLLMIDSQVPIGRGQRELYIGERRIGKEEAAIDTVINQTLNKTGVISIYVTIGSQTAFIKRAVEKIKSKGAIKNCIFIVGRASDSAPMNFLAPLTAVTIAESLAQKNKDVLVVFDNLTRHARTYRQISLLLKRAPGREAYPGDIFYLHSRLLERCGRFTQAVGGGSITAIPLVETVTEDITDYITTNLMSITDGHVLFTKALYHQGRRPAISTEYSVSRIGGKAQLPVLRNLSTELKTAIGRFNELEKLNSFANELQEETKLIVERGKRIFAFTNQDQSENLSLDEQSLIIYFLLSDNILRWPSEIADKLGKQFLDFIRTKEVKDKIKVALTAQTLEEVKPVFDAAIDAFAKSPQTLKQIDLDKTSAEKESISDVLKTMKETQ